MINLVGDGTYGLVYLAYNQENKEKVAIKTMKRKYHSWSEVILLSLPPRPQGDGPAWGEVPQEAQPPKRGQT